MTFSAVTMTDPPKVRIGMQGTSGNHDPKNWMDVAIARNFTLLPLDWLQTQVRQGLLVLTELLPHCT